MKAFQLKIGIKNAKPPIWRRVIVPAGITFSQFSMILNEVMGWSGSHLFEFEFYHLNLRIIEEAEEFAMDAYGSYDYLESSTTYIREYLTDNEWCTYIYDLGDCWEHRVAVEKILDDYEENYPKVMKYKGDCPGEDGAEPKNYDMEQVNEVLKDSYFYRWGEGEKRTQSEIFEEHRSGKPGLCATRRDKNKQDMVMQSNSKQVKEAMKQTAAMIKRWHAMEKKVHNVTLRSILSDYDEEDLWNIAEEKGIKVVCNIDKDQLIEKINAFMLQKEVLRKYFLYMTTETIDAMETAALSGQPREDIPQAIIEPLYCTAYAGVLGDGRVCMPVDVFMAYRSIADGDFHRNRKKRSWLLCCLRAAGILYGAVPMNILLRMLEMDSTIQLTVEEVREGIRELPPEYAEFILEKSMIYHQSYYQEAQLLLEAQKDSDFYIPNQSEIRDLGIEGYLPEKTELKEMIRFLIYQMGVSQEEAHFAGQMMQRMICGGSKPQELIDFIVDMGFQINKLQLREFDRLIKEMFSNTRMMIFRGFTLKEAEKGRIIRNVKKTECTKVIDFEEQRKQKIYPNDPCPCGSGKKYKNCCKKK